MRYKMTNNIKFVITRFVFFFKLKMHQNQFSATPSPFPSPLDAFGVSNSAPTAPRFSGPPQHKILATPVGYEQGLS